jgi:paired amphipathic helix protein Sin3a
MSSTVPPLESIAATAEDLALIERIKKYVGNKTSMNEFLKALHIYSIDIISEAQLCDHAEPLLAGNPELWRAFKDFLGIKNENKTLLAQPDTINSRVSLSNCRAYSASYRKLPKRERYRQCSGRDQLCKDVLNDVWASHPTWASEDSGFVAHKKNANEEALHKIEEERHDYDHNIKAIETVIQQLEPYNQQLRNMSAQERVQFKLPPGLGGHSEAIYQRVLFKVYGKEDGRRTIEFLKTTPYKAIPIVLHSLKHKAELWKAAYVS